MAGTASSALTRSAWAKATSLWTRNRPLPTAAVASLCDRLGLGPDRCRLTLVLHDWGVYGQAALPQIQPRGLSCSTRYPAQVSCPGAGLTTNRARLSLWSASVRAVGRDFDLRAVMPSMIFPSGSSDTVPAAVIDVYAAPFQGRNTRSRYDLAAGVRAWTEEGWRAAQGGSWWAWQNYEASIAMGTSDALFNGRKSEPRVREWLQGECHRAHRHRERISLRERGAADAVAAAINGFIARHADV